MPCGQTAAGGYIAGAEAGAAEAGLKEGSAFEQRLLYAVFDKLQINRHTRGVHGKGEITVAHIMSLKNSGGLGDVIVHSAGTACDDALIDHHLTVYHLAAQIKLQIAEACPLFSLTEDVSGVLLQLMDRICLRGVEGQRSHRLHFVKVNSHHGIVIGAFSGLQLPIVACAAADGQIFLHLFIGGPYG